MIPAVEEFLQGHLLLAWLGWFDFCFPSDPCAASALPWQRKKKKGKVSNGKVLRNQYWDNGIQVRRSTSKKDEMLENNFIALCYFYPINKISVSYPSIWDRVWKYIITNLSINIYFHKLVQRSIPFIYFSLDLPVFVYPQSWSNLLHKIRRIKDGEQSKYSQVLFELLYKYGIYCKLIKCGSKNTTLIECSRDLFSEMNEKLGG